MTFCDAFSLWRMSAPVCWTPAKSAVFLMIAYVITLHSLFIGFIWNSILCFQLKPPMYPECLYKIWLSLFALSYRNRFSFWLYSNLLRCTSGISLLCYKVYVIFLPVGMTNGKKIGANIMRLKNQPHFVSLELRAKRSSLKPKLSHHWWDRSA